MSNPVQFGGSFAADPYFVPATSLWRSGVAGLGEMERLNAYSAGEGDWGAPVASGFVPYDDPSDFPYADSPGAATALGLTFIEQLFGKDKVAEATAQAQEELKKLGKTVGEAAAPSIAAEARERTINLLPWVLGGILAVMFIGGTFGGLAARGRKRKR